MTPGSRRSRGSGSRRRCTSRGATTRRARSSSRSWGGDVAGLEAQALEGLGFTLESQGQLDAALTRFRELQDVQDGAFRDQAQFYQARVYVRKNEPERAKELLRQIVERIGRAAASDPTVTASLGLRDQAFTLLREVAPTDRSSSSTTARAPWGAPRRTRARGTTRRGSRRGSRRSCSARSRSRCGARSGAGEGA